MDADSVMKAIMAGAVFALLGAIIWLVWTVWETITNPKIARKVGKDVKRGIDGAANAAGQTSATIAAVAKSARQSFADGRGSNNSSKASPAHSESQSERYENLAKLKVLLDSGAITKTEYDREKSRLLPD